MSDWIDFCVYAAFIVGFYFVLPRHTRARNRLFLAERNAAWLAAHPNAPSRYNGSRAYLWSCYAFGAAWLGVLCAFQLGMLPEPSPPEGQTDLGWQMLWGITMLSCLFGLLLLFAGSIVFSVRCAGKVPLTERRQATLERRSIDDFVPRWVRTAIYALAIVNLAAWLIVGALQIYSTPIFWARVVIMFGLSAFFFVATNAAVNRRPTAVDRVFGPAMRRTEVRVGFGMQLLPPLVGAVRLYEALTATIVFDVNRAMQLALVGSVAFIFLLTARAPRVPPAAGSPPCTPHSADSSGA